MPLLEDLKTVPASDKKDRPLTVCFVCTGNTCRSPMAEALVNDMMSEKPICSACDIDRMLNRKQVRATSAGLMAFGAPIAPNAVRALENAGVFCTQNNDYRQHRSRTIDEDILESSDLIICMTGLHAMQLLSEFPSYASKITSMPKDISDPYGGDPAVYDACLAEIKQGIEQMGLCEGNA